MNSESNIANTNIADRVFLQSPIILIPPSGTVQPFGTGSGSRDFLLPHSEEHYNELRNRIAQILISCGFFEKTKFRDFSFSFQISNFWDQGKDVSLSVSDGGLFGNRKIYLADFWQMTQSEFLDFKTCVAAEILIAACKKYKLDDSAAQHLAAAYPVRDIEFSFVTLTPTVSLVAPLPEHQFQLLTNEELTFPHHDLYRWCVSDPFTEERLKQIGPTTLSVRVPVDLPIDQYVQIANAMNNAPLATLCIYSFMQGSDLRFLEYFGNVGRISIDVREYVDLSCLNHFSKNLVHLELILSEKGTRPSLEALRHFDNLQSLLLRGHYEDLSRFPKLASLRALLLSNVSLKDLSSVAWLPALRSFAMADSNISDVSAISKMTTLQYLILARLPKLLCAPDLSQLRQLEYLNLIGLTKLAQIGSLANSTKLRRLALCGLKSLTSLTEVKEAPNLEELLLESMKQLPLDCLAWSKDHKTFTALRTDNIALEKASGLKRSGTGKAFVFSPPVNDVVLERLEPEVEVSSTTTTSVESVDDVGEDESEERVEELRVHIPISDSFGGAEDYLDCTAIEERLEQILESEFVGRWSGHEIGQGMFDIFYEGEDSQLMFEALNVELKEILPVGSSVEVRRSNGDVVVTKY